MAAMRRIAFRPLPALFALSDFIIRYSKLTLRLSRHHAFAQVFSGFLIALLLAGQALLLSFVDPGVPRLLSTFGEHQARAENKRGRQPGPTQRPTTHQRSC